jgi:large subunit ribosomal protein L18e
MQNPVLLDTIKKLKSVGKTNKAGVWLATARMLSRSRSKRAIVNVGKIAKYTKDGNKVIVPGKVLGSGNINHKIELASFGISLEAAKKVKEAGGIILTINEMLERYPNGKEVIIIG